MKGLLSGRVPMAVLLELIFEKLAPSLQGSMMGLTENPAGAPAFPLLLRRLLVVR
jgi:hypothetical protein